LQQQLQNAHFFHFLMFQIVKIRNWRMAFAQYANREPAKMRITA
jgi:hypothetical protein